MAPFVLSRPEERGAILVERRGHELGWVRGARKSSRASTATARSDVDEPRRKWKEAEPIPLTGLLDAEVKASRSSIRRSLDLLDAVRGGADLRDLLRDRKDYRARLDGDFRFTGVSEDVLDEREIQKVHFDAVRGDTVVGEDLFIKVNWLSLYDEDGSIRLRFSFGSERLQDWQTDPGRSACATVLAERVFPECALISRNANVAETLRRIIGSKVHYPERIIYSNSPHGGAVFHHDFVGEEQCGVIFAQLAGVTGWLTCPKVRLVRHLIEHVHAHGGARSVQRLVGAGERALLDALEEQPLDRSLKVILNEDPRFFARLVEAGDFLVLRPGDAILLPSHGLDAVAWHSVFCLRPTRSLALSFAIRKGAPKKPGLGYLARPLEKSGVVSWASPS